MNRYVIRLLLAGIMLLSALVACRPQTTPAPTAVSQQPTATPLPAATSTPKTVATATATTQAAATPTTKLEATPIEQTAATPTKEKATPPIGGQVEPTATPVWQIPPVAEDDWAKGNPNAKMVLVEYSDLQ